MTCVQWRGMASTCGVVGRVGRDGRGTDRLPLSRAYRYRLALAMSYRYR